MSHYVPNVVIVVDGRGNFVNALCEFPTTIHFCQTRNGEVVSVKEVDSSLDILIEETIEEFKSSFTKS